MLIHIRLRSILFFLFVIVSTIKAQWNWQNPSPTGNNLNNLFFLDSSLGWCVGQVGTIIKTSNGGVSWETQESNTDSDLNGIYFIDELNGWIVGNGVILSTIDGGESWNSRLLNPAINFNSVYFIDKENGWCCGDSLVYSTTDGGNTWNSQGIKSSSNLKSITFLNLQTGWVVGYNNAFKTTDGGKTWNAVSLPNQFQNSDLQKIEFVSQSVGWIVGSRFKYLCCNSSSLSGSIWKTEDGGSSWNIVFFDSTAFSFYYPRYYFTDITFADSENGLFNSIYGIYSTNDGGINWNFTSNNLSSSYFMATNNIVYAAGLEGILYKSTDTAKTWQKISKGDRVNLNKIQFFDSLKGIAAGYSDYTAGSSVLRTSDGGRNWNSIDFFYKKKVGITDLSFIDSLKGWASSREFYQGTNYSYNSGVIFSTTDGGDNWAQMTDDSSYYGLFAIKFRDSKNGITVGAGEILITTDAGKNWKSSYYGFGGEPEFYSLAFQDSERIWVGGLEPLFYTINKGLTWQRDSVLASMGYYTIRDIIFVNYSTGFIAGLDASDQSGFILKTSDGGNTWLNTLKEPSVSFNSLFFYDENNGIAVGDSGTIAVTTNGGSSWSVHKIPHVRNNLFSISTTDPLNIWIAGGNGAIIKGKIPSITFVNNIRGSGLPDDYQLSQNYPNPFNPTTTISYSIPNESFVTIKVYDILGREVETLVNEEKNAGNYNVNFNAGNLSSGIYFYRMQAGNFIQTKKLLLLK